MRFPLSLIFFVGLGLSVSWGQRTLYFNYLGKEESLSQLDNMFITPISSGEVFIGSQGGLNLFDGHKIYYQGIKDTAANNFEVINTQSDAFENDRGEVWYATGAGLNSYNIFTGHTTTFTLGPDTIASGPHYAFFLEQKRFLWVNTAGSFYRFDTYHPNQSTKSSAIAPTKSVRAIVDTNRYGQVVAIYGGYWIMGSGIELTTIGANSKLLNQSRVHENFVTSTQNPVQISKLISPREGQLWMIGNSTLINISTSHPDSIKAFQYPDEKPPKFRDLIWRTEEEIWLLSSNQGIFSFNTKTQQFSKSLFRLMDLKTQSEINGGQKFIVDNNDILWISRLGKGVYYTNLNAFAIKRPFLENNISKRPANKLFTSADDQIWLIDSDSSCQVFNVEGQLIKTLKTPSHLKFTPLPDGDICLQSDLGWSRLSQAKRHKLDWQSTGIQLGDNATPIAFKQNNLLGELAGKLAVYSLSNNALLDTIPAPLAGFRILLNVNDRQLWLSNSEGNIQVNKIKSSEQFSLGPVSKTFQALGIINQLFHDQARELVWVASSKGLYRISTNDFSIKQFNQEDGLPNSYIYAIAADTKGGLWLSSNAGIFCFIEQNGSIDIPYHLTYKDGLSSTEYARGSVTTTTNGLIWFGGNQGIDIINPAEAKPLNNPPKLILQRLEINEVPWSGDSLIQYQKLLCLSHKENNLNFHYAAPEFTDPSRNNYQVFLIYEGDTITNRIMGHKQNFYFPNLRPGHYKFAFTAASANGVWQKKPLELPFYIVPPVHQRSWFKFLMLLGVLGIVAVITSVYYRYQLRIQEREAAIRQRETERKQLIAEKKLALEKERRRIAGEMHDDLGLGLSTISNSSYKIGRKKELADILPVNETIGSLARDLIENMRAIIWTMDPNLDSLEDLVGKVRHYAAKMLDANDIEATFDIVDEAHYPNLSLGSQFRHHIYRMVKEVLHNLVKHAQADKVQFQLSLNGRLIIRIQDNGTGFTPEKATNKGSGLNLLKQRATELGGSITWKISPGGGTITTINVPLPAAGVN